MAPLVSINLKENKSMNAIFVQQSLRQRLLWLILIANIKIYKCTNRFFCAISHRFRTFENIDHKSILPDVCQKREKRSVYRPETVRKDYTIAKTSIGVGRHGGLYQSPRYVNGCYPILFLAKWNAWHSYLLHSSECIYVYVCVCVWCCLYVFVYVCMCPSMWTPHCGPHKNGLR